MELFSVEVDNEASVAVGKNISSLKVEIVVGSVVIGVSLLGFGFGVHNTDITYSQNCFSHDAKGVS